MSTTPVGSRRTASAPKSEIGLGAAVLREAIRTMRGVGANVVNGALLGGALGVLFAPATLGVSIPVVTLLGVGAGLAMPVDKG